jgi:transposase
MSSYHYIEEMFKLEEGCIKYSEFLGNKQIFYVESTRRICTCPHCHSHTNLIKDYRQQEILLSWFNDVPVYASLRKRRYVCSVCGHSFYAPAPLIQPYQRRSHHQQLAILQECARKQSFTDIATRFHLSVTTVIRYFDHISYGKSATLPANWMNLRGMRRSRNTKCLL